MLLSFHIFSPSSRIKWHFFYSKNWLRWDLTLKTENQTVCSLLYRNSCTFVFGPNCLIMATFMNRSCRTATTHCIRTFGPTNQSVSAVPAGLGGAEYVIFPNTIKCVKWWTLHHRHQLNDTASGSARAAGYHGLVSTRTRVSLPCSQRCIRCHLRPLI